MSDNVQSPSSSFDILVLGTKGVGKTTLLTVLGMKFERMGAFGLSMVPCDRETQLFTRNAARNMIVNNAFPAATDRTDARPLSWNVLAGTEPLFRLSSLDCAGETLSQVFSDDQSDLDIDEGDDQRSVKEALSNLADRAVAVCLVLAPHQLPGNRSLRDAADPGVAARMDEVDDLIYLAAHSSRFEGKKLVVALTRTDEFHVREEITREGGPRGYLRAKCPVLANSKRFEDAHVIAVAPVVTRPSGEGGDGAAPAVVPANFESFGLEDFLVALGGSILSPLSPLAESCRALLKAEWLDAQTLRSGGAAERLAAARRRHAAAKMFQTAADLFCGKAAVDADVRIATDARVLQSVIAAQVRLAVEEAVSNTLVGTGAPSDSSLLRDALVSAARSAAKSVPGAPPAKDDDFFLSSSVWAESERVALPRARHERKAALDAAIANRNKSAALTALAAWLDIADNPRSSAMMEMQRKVERIKPPLPPEQKAVRRVLAFVAIFVGAAIVGGHAANTIQVECNLCEGIGKRPCKTCQEKGIVDCWASGTEWIPDRQGNRLHVERCRTCGGRGSRPVPVWNNFGLIIGQRPVECETCGGKGWTRLCRDCKGSGQIPCRDCKELGKRPCKKCQGRGTVAWIDRDETVFE